MPILGQNHRLKPAHQGVDAADYLITISNGQCALRAKVVLNVNYDKGFGHVILPLQHGYGAAVAGSSISQTGALDAGRLRA
jgi:hypothetical protein